jgi:hypothetical protein
MTTETMRSVVESEIRLQAYTAIDRAIGCAREQKVSVPLSVSSARRALNGAGFDATAVLAAIDEARDQDDAAGVEWDRCAAIVRPLMAVTAVLRQCV